MPTDIEQLLAMGFDSERAGLAAKQTGSLQDALDWLEKTQDTPLEELKAAEASASAAAAASDEPPALKPGEEAHSLVCDDCGKKFRSQAQAEWHASKTEHTNFSESTEEIAPLTEEQKKERLAELKEKMATKKVAQAEQDKIDRKKNEQIRMKSTKETQDVKEELRKKEQLKEMAAKRKEKQDEADARKRVLAKLEADKLERKRKAETEKAQRAGQAAPQYAEPAAPTSSGPTTSKPASAYTEARLALQTPTGRVMKTFPVETTLFEVAHALEESGVEVNSFTQNFPKKVYDKTDFGMTLKEASMVPSAALIVK